MTTPDPKPYQWDFDGSCAPGSSQWTGTYQTFSLGIFQWVPKRGGRGLRGELKRGKVQRRVRGITSNPAEAFDRVREIVAELNRREGAR